MLSSFTLLSRRISPPSFCSALRSSPLARSPARTYVSLPSNLEQLWGAIVGGDTVKRAKVVRVKFAQRFKKSRTRQRLKTASTKLQKTHQTFREYKYSRSISLNLPISASLNPELGSGWFDSTGAPLVTKSKNGRYVIPWETEATKKSFYSFLGWQWERFWGTSEGKLIPGEGELKVVKPVLPEEIEGGYLTWLGHASAVFSVFGEDNKIVHILTDPHFTDRASPVKGVGPKRFRKCVGVEEGDEGLEENNNKKIQYFVPLGIKALLTRSGIPSTRVTELGWWDSSTHLGIKITCTPAQHWSSRTPWDRNKRLWCGWVMQSPDDKNSSFYYTGDTGLPRGFPLFEMIGDRLGPFELCAIPIGAYKPRWFMASQHCDPSGAVRIHKAVRSRRTVAVHWGTFPLADEGWDEPRTDLDMACKDEGVCRVEEFVTLGHGEGIGVREEEVEEDGVYDFLMGGEEEEEDFEELEELEELELREGEEEIRERQGI
ncbi:hypothetical protein TL16_g08171 [Triparma laevis f. inornata]|uniref:Metallo-beta-lactamase domain-containing protein n=1 Tax=Triparma laevis f. inornata TaxID=1714386 RepID=A0A9W7B4N3_9STRA|nr:hypothetical protein TL16_g08171 [Triparma laevis f. inornata]